MYIEADFRREYGIDLIKEIKGMSWRKFQVLLFSLSSNSIWMNIVMREEQIIADPFEAEKAVNAIWK